MFQVLHPLDDIEARVHKIFQMGKLARPERHAEAVVVGGQFRNNGLKECGQIRMAAIRGINERSGVCL